MKRCQQCDFVYEDEQQLCDMDGAQLVFDSKFLAESVSAPAAAIQTKVSVNERPILPEAPAQYETVAHEEMTAHDEEQTLFEAPADGEIPDSYEGRAASSLMPHPLGDVLKKDSLVIANRTNQQPRLRWTNVTVIAIAAAVTSAALSFGNLPSTQIDTQSGTQQTSQAAEVTDAPADRTPSLDPATDAEDPVNSPNVAEPSNTGTEETTVAPPNSDIVGSVNRVPTEKSSNKKGRTPSRGPSLTAKKEPSRSTPKKGSRVGSLLKSTGRAIKKPFKF